MGIETLVLMWVSLFQVFLMFASAFGYKWADRWGLVALVFNLTLAFGLIVYWSLK